jgi:hypothetical protein
MKAIIGILVPGLLALGLAPGAAADVLVVHPAEAVVLPADTSGLTKIVLRFDLSGMRAEENLHISHAYVDWILPGVPSDRESEYATYAVTAAWSADAVASGAAHVEAAEEPSATWEITPADYEVVGGLVRLDLVDLVTAWANGTKSNYGIVLATPDVGSEGLAGELVRATLTVRYGFVRP